MIEQTRFLSTVFLCGEFKLENTYSGINFCGKNVCGNLYLGELFLRIAGKIAKIRTRKNFVPQLNTVYYQNQGVKTLIIAPSFS